MSPIGDGFGAALVIIAACALPTQVWRWFGVAVGAHVDANSEVLHWVRAIATAIIAAFVAKVLVFPTGALADAPLWLRLTAAGVAIAAYAAARRLVVVGVFAGMATLVIGRMLTG